MGGLKILSRYYLKLYESQQKRIFKKYWIKYLDESRKKSWNFQGRVKIYSNPKTVESLLVASVTNLHFTQKTQMPPFHPSKCRILLEK